MDDIKLKDILDKHVKWLNREDGGECADLRRADLSGANLCGADLSGADLCGADLRRADLSGANLSGADLSGAYLCGAYLSGADLCGAYLCGADLCGADLSGADLCGADLRRADLSGADLSGAKNVPYAPMLIPDGEFIAWKKLKGYIVKLKVLEDSKRSRATSEKCRCDKALVLDIQNLDGSPSGLEHIFNHEYAECEYKVGEVVYADEWDEDRWHECSHGIHFFIDRQTAVNY